MSELTYFKKDVEIWLTPLKYHAIIKLHRARDKRFGGKENEKVVDNDLKIWYLIEVASQRQEHKEH